MPTPTDRKESSLPPGAEVWLSLGLAFVGGYGDAAGFVLTKTFTGHVTGNLVLGAISIAARDGRATVGHVMAITVFLLGVLSTVLLIRPIKAWTSWPLLPAVMAIEVVLIVAASFALEFPFALRMEIFVVCVSLALGLQNGAFRHAGGVSVHTTYLTGMITSLITKKAEEHALQAVPQPEGSPHPQINLLYSIWTAFFLGAGIGAAMCFRFKGLGMLGAALVLITLILFHATRVTN